MEVASTKSAITKVQATVIAVIIIVAGIVGVVYYWNFLTPTPGRTIRFGCPLDLSGPNAFFDIDCKWALEYGVKIINEQGGVYVKELGCKLPVELVIRDYGGDLSKCATVTTELILEDRVDIIVSDMSYTGSTVSSIGDRYKTPTIIAEPFDAWAAGGPYKYGWDIQFRIAAPYEKPGYTIMENQLAVLDSIANQTNRRVAVLALDDADGRGWYISLPQFLTEHGYECWGVERNLGLYPPGTTDFTSIIREWKNADCQILVGNLIPQDFAIILKQMDALGYWPKFAAIGRAALRYEDVKAYEDYAEGIVTEMWGMFREDLPTEYFGFFNYTIKDLYEAYIRDMGKVPSEFPSMAFDNLLVAVNAIERAGSLDKDKINEAIATTNLAKSTSGPLKATDDHSIARPVFYVQWQKVNGKLQPRVIFSLHPSLPKEAELIFPLPRYHQ